MPHPSTPQSRPTSRALLTGLLATLSLALALLGVTGLTVPPPASAAPDAETISLPGTHNTAMGCATDWSPDCAAATLTKDPESGIHTGTFTLPAGTYQYKVAVGGTWDTNYGKDGAPVGGDIEYTTAGGPITFYYDPATHRAWSTTDGPTITLPGDFQSALGCTQGDQGGNWAPACLATLMHPNGDGTWSYSTSSLPPGTHQVKVAHGLAWDENYGVDGAAGGENYSFTTKAGEQVHFTYTLADHRLGITTASPGVAGVGESRAYWIDETTLAWPVSLLPAGVSRDAVVDAQGSPVPGAPISLSLVTAPDGGAAVTDGAVTGGTLTPLRITGDLPASVLMAHPNLRGYIAASLTGADGAPALSRAQVEEALTGQVGVVQQGADGTGATAFTGIQLAPALDALFPASARDGSAPLGVVWDGARPSFHLWAPTAKSATLLTWGTASETGSAPEAGGEAVRTAATRGPDGRWSVDNADGAIAAGSQYLWEVRVYVPATGKVETNLVTDPYSTALTTDSTRSVAVDASAPSLAPQQWSSATAPTLANDAAHTIYELHVRDFSIHDTTVPESYRGTYRAFTQSDSDGMKHLRSLADAGMNTIHLLPTFDIATIPEDRAKQVTAPVPDAGPASEEQQAAVASTADTDGFNWGYDPYHYTAPEGSYATAENQNGGARIMEYREMVGALHGAGYQVVLDQVFNHTPASGQDATSVLDRVVPGYYQRLKADGVVENSTCCSNTASENAMMERLMIDSVVTWARDYHVDGFRFDLMGHHSRDTMVRLRDALRALTPDKDGVDGSAIYLYGEGWNFGEVANNALFQQATQGQLGGTGIGTFNDRLRDAVHGGGPFDDDHRTYQGFGTGAVTDPNGLDPRPEADQKADLAHRTDLVRIGLAGNLSDYSFTASDGTVRTGAELDYNGAKAGYASSPEESVNYVDAHDNETLYDLGVFKLRTDLPMADRVRMNTVSLATVALGQSPSFWAAGTEGLRSKSLDRDSYNSGDHFNAIDWSGQDNGFGKGLPVKSKNGEKWPIMTPLLQDPSLKPSAADISAAQAQSMDLLRLRSSTPLFSLGDAGLIKAKLSFPGSGPEQAPGVITMLVNDPADGSAGGVDSDPALAGVLTVFNASDEPITQVVPGLAGRGFALSDVQAAGTDEVVKGTTFDAATGTVTVPARTVAVLTEKQGATPQPSPTPDPSPAPSPDPTPAPSPSPAPDPSASGWVWSGSAWTYVDPATGQAVTGWLKDAGSWYYLDPATGAMATGWARVGTLWYYLRPDGAMATGWTAVGGHWYFLEPAWGHMITGWIATGGHWYYLAPDGAMAAGWQWINGAWYYLDGTTGAMRTGWLKDGASWYYLDPATGRLTP